MALARQLVFLDTQGQEALGNLSAASCDEFQGLHEGEELREEVLVLF